MSCAEVEATKSVVSRSKAPDVRAARTVQLCVTRIVRMRYLLRSRASNRELYLREIITLDSNDKPRCQVGGEDLMNCCR